MNFRFLLSAAETAWEKLDPAVLDTNQLFNRIALVDPGNTVTLKVFRDGAVTTLEAKIGEQPERW